MAWTQEQAEALRHARVVEKMTHMALAEHFDRSVDEIKSQLDRMGLVTRRPRSESPWTPEALARLRQLHAEGLSDVEISEAMGMSRPAVTAKRSYLGLPVNAMVNKTGTDWSEEKMHLLRSLVLDGYTNAEIAKRIGGGATRSSVIGAMQRYGIKRPKEIRDRLSSQAASGGGSVRVRVKLPPRPIAPVFQYDSGARTEAYVPPSEPLPDNLLTLADLTPRSCRYIHGDVQHGEWGFCGEKVRHGSSYCHEHHALTHVRVPKEASEDDDAEEMAA